MSQRILTSLPGNAPAILATGLAAVLGATLAPARPAGAQGPPFPAVIPLPNGISPEGIASGTGTRFFVGSLANGAIYEGSYRTGEGRFLHDPAAFGEQRMAVGLAHDARSDLLWVAGGLAGTGYVYDTDSGATLARLALTSAMPAFVNDVILTRTAAWFTDSFQPVLHRVPLDRRRLPAGPAQSVPLAGDFVFVPQAMNANGIDATPDGRTLLLVNSATGALYTVDPGTGVAAAVDLGGATLPAADGILLDGRTLYVVQNLLERIAVVRLSADLRSGIVSDDPIASPQFMIPTTVARFADSLFVVNSRLNVPPGPSVEYQLVRVARER